MKNPWLHFSLGVLILGVVVWRADLEKLEVYAHHLKLSTVIWVTGCLVLFHLLKGVRWQLILLTQRITYGFREALKIYWSGLFIGVVTPGRLGDLVRVVYLKRDGIRIGRGMAGVLVDRLLDIGVLVVLLASGCGSLIWAKGAVSFSLAAGGGLGRRQLWRCASWIFPAPWRGALGGGWDELAKGFGMFLSARGKLASVLVLTGLSWGLYLWTVQLLVEAIGLRLVPGLTALFLAVAALASFLPFSVAGIGTRDALLVYLAKFVGLGSEEALAFSACVLLLHLLTALIGAVGWTQSRRLRRQAHLEVGR